MPENTPSNDTPANPGPLAGYRVLDFGWVLAGAIPGMVLADMGAEVIKVETRQRLDYMRMGRPIVGDQPDPEQNPMFHNVNRNKLSVTLNISQPEAVTLAKRLLERCDVVIENFSPGVMDRLGLGYQELSRIKPDIVMASISSTGQSGPLRDLRAYAPSIGALAGLDSTQGYEGERPLGLKHAYGDICGALHTVFAIVAALYQRKRTGRGQYIDLSMLRATVVTQGVGLMEYIMAGRALQPRGNYDPTMAPYGNYPCQSAATAAAREAPPQSPPDNHHSTLREGATAQEDDRWVSIAVSTEEEWQSLKEALGSPDWPGTPPEPPPGIHHSTLRAWATVWEAPEFASKYQRLKNRQQLDHHLSRWTATATAEEITELLQSRGVAAMPVMGAEERLFDPHFRERGLYQDIDHPALGAEPIFNLMWNLSRTPSSIRRHAPLMGEHNRQVLCDMLGLSEAEVTGLEERQVVY